MTKIFGKSRSTNDLLVEEQLRQAKLAEDRAEAEKARREAAFGEINETFDGIGDEFYDRYRGLVMGGLQPQLDDQFETASRNNFFNFTRRGLGRSTALSQAIADLEKRRALAQAGIVGAADEATTGLRDRVSAERRAALGLASSAEDPSQAASRALTEVNQIQSLRPNTSPLGDIFQVAASAYSADAARRAREAYASAVPGFSSASTGRIIS